MESLNQDKKVQSQGYHSDGQLEMHGDEHHEHVEADFEEHRICQGEMQNNLVY